MIKKSIFLTIILLFSITTFAFAHTGLESSSPKKGETIESDLKEITLTFEGKLENGSSFTLENNDGQSIPVENITLDGKQLTGELINTLENGEYVINWKIIGADGHVIDGEIPFTIALPIVEEKTDETTQSETTTKEQSTVEDNSIKEDSEQESSSSALVPTIIVVLVLIMLGSMIALYKRKK